VSANRCILLAVFLTLLAGGCLHSRAQTAELKITSLLSSADTLNIRLQDAESILIKNNLQLIARRYDIETARAQILQAKLWDNPTIYLETNPLNNASGRYFNFMPANNFNINDKSTYGNEVIAAIDQVIKTAGKRSNLVQLNRINTQIAEFVFADAIRSLKFTLRYDYSLMVQFQKSISLLDNEYKSIQVLVDIIHEQLLKGNFAEKDLLRLQALAFDLQMQRKDFITQLADVEAEVRTLLGVRTGVFVKPIADSTRFKRTIPDSADSLISIALEIRPDLNLSESQLHFSTQNLKLQRSLSYPDLDVTLNYTRYSNYLPDYYGLGLRLPLPLLNRNQGNIKGAKSDIQSSQSDFENQKIRTMNEVISNYLQLQVTKNSFENFDRPFVGKFDQYFQKLILNFRRRVIGLIEFIDFFETYRDTKLASFNLEQDYFQAQEQLNFSVGKDIIK
jgi:outer membrane protein, heavy metal efflux system